MYHKSSKNNFVRKNYFVTKTFKMYSFIIAQNTLKPMKLIALFLFNPYTNS